MYTNRSLFTPHKGRSKVYKILITMLKEIKELVKAILKTQYRKIVFLDFDGVLCPINDIPIEGRDRYGMLFNPQCVNALNQIIEATGAEIVISSSWRGGLSLWKLIRMWRKRNMKGAIVGVTPSQNNHRGDEIDMWIKLHNLINYVIIDDMGLAQFHEHHKSHLVICNGRIGIDETVVKRAIKILNSE